MEFYENANLLMGDRIYHCTSDEDDDSCEDIYSGLGGCDCDD